MKFNQLISKFDLIDRVEGIAFNFINGDWQKNKKKYGWTGVVKTFLTCLFQQNIYEFKVNRDSLWSGIQLEKALFRNGVKLGNRGLSWKGDEEYLYFWVKRRQQKWAEYLMMRMGIPVENVKDKKNYEVANRFAMSNRERDPSKVRKKR